MFWTQVNFGNNKYNIIYNLLEIQLIFSFMYILFFLLPVSNTAYFQAVLDKQSAKQRLVWEQENASPCKIFHLVWAIHHDGWEALYRLKHRGPLQVN